MSYKINFLFLQQTLQQAFRSSFLWLEDYLESWKRIRQIVVSEEISSRCKVGWTVFSLDCKNRRGLEDSGKREYVSLMVSG